MADFNTVKEFEYYGYKYSVINEAEKTVSLVGANKDVPEKLVIPETVKYRSVTYRVIKVSVDFSNLLKPNFFRNVKSIVFPESVSEIACILPLNCKYSGKHLNTDGLYICKDKLVRVFGNPFTLTLPSSVTSIGSYAFSRCSSLTSVTIPSSVTEIDNCAFCDCSSLTSITIPSSVTKIGDGAFYGCSSLTSVTIPSSVTSIGSSAFSECSSLTSITLPSSVTSIGDRAFLNCSSLTSITIPSSVTKIGDGTFFKCSSLTSITLPSSVTKIGYGAFSGCSSLTSITLPSSVTSIGEYAFKECSSLTSIKVEGDNKVYDSREGCNAIIETATNTLIVGGKSTIIPNSVTSIGDRAFLNCSSLTSITIPNSVTSIGKSAFYECSSLTSITIPNSVTSIGESAFYGCSRLTSITIPNSVTSIGKYAFDIPNLKVTICNEKGCVSISQDAFRNTAEINYIGKNGVARVEKTTEHNSQTKTAKIKENSKKEGTHAEKKQGFFKRLFGKILNN